MQDFEAALDEVQPAFGANAESLQKNVMQVRVSAVQHRSGHSNQQTGLALGAAQHKCRLEELTAA
jgi:hypothetical protein